MLGKLAYRWTVVVPVPPRVVFATMEQLIGTPPYRFEVVSAEEARIVEHRRRGFFGQWSRPRLGVRWVTCRAVPVAHGARVEIAASSGGGPLWKALGRADRGAVTRALQLAALYMAGADDQKTIYRRRRIPPGPVTLVASWAGMAYRLFTEPRDDAPRSEEIFTATELEAISGEEGPFVRVRLVRTGVEGWVERDQVVAAPEKATREAQLEAARYV